jgi:hypothetical protein
MHTQGRPYRLLVVGGGPAGLAPLLAAHRDGILDSLLEAGVAVVEQSAALGAGAIGGYGINSDSSGRTFTDCLQGPAPSELTALGDHPLTRQLDAAGDGAVPLRDAGRFLALVGEALTRAIGRHPASAALTRHRAIEAHRCEGGWRVKVEDLATGVTRTLHAENIVLATGATQPAARLNQEMVGGFDLAALAGDRLMQSGDVLAEGGLARVQTRLAANPAPRIAIIGGSTSAAAVAHALLHRLPQLALSEGAVTLLHRRELRIYYPDRAAALADGYTEWTEDDICPISNRVFRFAGFRLDSRALIMQARGIGNAAPEPRLRLHKLQDHDSQAAAIIRAADIVVAALGYRPRALSLLDATGERITLLAETGPQMAMVDGQCRVLDALAMPVPGVFGIGLAAGFLPRGGEPSFRGQANGLWLWQHDVGALIVDAVVSVDTPVAAPKPALSASPTPSHLPPIPAISLQHPANLNNPLTAAVSAVGAG